MFPSCKVGIEHMIDFIPNIKPRLYSIASAQETMGDTLQLCIINDDWVTPKGKPKNGLATQYLRSLDPANKDEFVTGNIVAGGVHVPPHHKDPFVMVALGTGIAPMRAMLQERDTWKKRGEEVGKTAFYFGVRNSSNEYTYGEELEAYRDSGIITHLRPAFSRDQAEKIYVQHRMKEQDKLLVDWFMNENAHLYLCGPAGSVPAAVRKMLAAAFEEHAGMSAEEADAYLTELQIAGRYNLDVW